MRGVQVTLGPNVRCPQIFGIDDGISGIRASRLSRCVGNAMLNASLRIWRYCPLISMTTMSSLSLLFVIWRYPVLLLHERDLRTYWLPCCVFRQRVSHGVADCVAQLWRWLMGGGGGALVFGDVNRLVQCVICWHFLGGGLDGLIVGMTRG